MNETAAPAAAKTLAELEAGDQYKTNEGRPEWLRIINISDPDGDEPRYALVEQLGGKRRGWRFNVTMYDSQRGWTVR